VVDTSITYNININFALIESSVRQKIACNVCVSRPADCATFTPDATQFNPTRPPPSGLGKLIVCDPSEREIWMTDDRFKVGDAEHQPEESRTGCPGSTPDSENRKPLYDGKLGFVRDHLCPLFSKDLPPKKDDKSCTAYMQKAAPNANGPNPDSCAKRFQYPSETLTTLNKISLRGLQ
jgi:hypothetical protein